MPERIRNQQVESVEYHVRDVIKSMEGYDLFTLSFSVGWLRQDPVLHSLWRIGWRLADQFNEEENRRAII